MPVKQIIKCLSLTLGIVLFSLPANSGLLSDGDVILDTDTGYEFLHSRYTGGTFPNQYLFANIPQIKPVPAGFRVANRQEALALFASVGIAPEVQQSLAAYTPVDTLMTFMGHLYEFNISRTQRNLGLTINEKTPYPFDSDLDYVSFMLRTDLAAGGTNPRGSLTEEAHRISNAGSRTATLMVRNRANAKPSNPVMPTITDPVSNARSFNNVNAKGVWVSALAPDPESNLKVVSATSAGITHVGIASTFTDADNQVMLIDNEEVISLNPGDVHQLSSPLMMIELMGIAGTQSPDPLAITAGGDLPIFLAFEGEEAEFTVSTVPIPEPASFALLLLGSALMMKRNR